jgi:hypothetical protein
MTTSAIVEKIIQDHYGRKGAVHFCALGDDINNSLLATELSLSPYINIENAVSQITNAMPSLHHPDALLAFHSRELGNKLHLVADQDSALATMGLNVISIINTLSDKTNDEQAAIINGAWQKLAPNGLLIVHETNSNLSPEHINQQLSKLGTTKYYSSIVASEHKADVEISHYSLLIEEELREENKNKAGVFWVVQK